jgi:hypothetical protein
VKVLQLDYLESRRLKGGSQHLKAEIELESVTLHQALKSQPVDRKVLS